MSDADYIADIRSQLARIEAQMAGDDEDYKLSARGLLKHISNRLDALEQSSVKIDWTSGRVDLGPQA